tara:strand:+ start:475 stop:1338 length:864 start_codon:yes stop_codon:yes gene_type:complete
MNILLDDGDLVVYEVAFCAEKKIKDGEDVTWFQVKKIVDTVVCKILRKSKCSHYLAFLTDGKSNFRVKRATLLPYKGNRKTNREKPHFYEDIRHYLQNHWDFQVMYGVEADDALTIASEYFKDTEHETTIGTIDKDLYQYAGNHMNTKTGELFTLTKEEAHRNLWKQMILGDPATDNIPSLSFAYRNEGKGKPIPDHQFGKKTAEKLLDSWKPEDYPKNIYELYVDAYDDGDGDDRPEQVFHEIFDLIFMLREKPEGLKIHFNPRKIRKSDVEYRSDITNFRPQLEF